MDLLSEELCVSLFYVESEDGGNGVGNGGEAVVNSPS